jgi:hydrogenase assembly chaperone HypC/HupF
MCFTEPGRVGSIDGSTARVTTSEGLRDASLRLIEAEGRSVDVGDWVLVSLGLVVDVVDADVGRTLYDEVKSMRSEALP